jgi:hypothetical protein
MQYLPEIPRVSSLFAYAMSTQSAATSSLTGALQRAGSAAKGDEEGVESDEFVALSAVLTGFEPFDLLGAGVVDEYLATLLRIVPAATAEMLDTWRQIEQAPPAGGVEEGVRIRILDHPRLGPVARNVITLWYTGLWAPMPDAWTYANGTSPADVNHVVSALAYQESLVWKAAGTGPMGAKPPGFGAWALPPAGDLSTPNP